MAIANALSRGIHATKVAYQKRRLAYLNRYPRTFASGASVDLFAEPHARELARRIDHHAPEALADVGGERQPLGRCSWPPARVVWLRMAWRTSSAVEPGKSV